MSITDWPEGERPREKLLQKGAAALSDAELLAIAHRCNRQECGRLGARVA
jgi:DNA repair protein RadC